MPGSINLALCLGVLLICKASAHFQLDYPETIGFDDENEGTAPCGGVNVTFENPTDFHVDGDAIALTSSHPEAEWTYRATLDKTAAGNWTDLLPVVEAVGLGAFCEPAIRVPTSWVGSGGIIQIISDAADGALYQCAAVNFVAGSATSPPPACRNATGLTASFASNSSLPGATSATGVTSTPAGSTPTSENAASPSASAAAGISIQSYTAFNSLLWTSLVGSALVVIMVGLIST